MGKSQAQLAFSSRYDKPGLENLNDFAALVHRTAVANALEKFKPFTPEHHIRIFQAA
jgi:hypothetical protein